jgi:hypothetical protein
MFFNNKGLSLCSINYQIQVMFDPPATAKANKAISTAVKFFFILTSPIAKLTGVR